MTNFNPEWLLRIMCAVITGMVIGYERHSRSKEAGVRTHAIVSLTSCVLMLLSRHAFENGADLSRIAASVVSGIGFLGTGIIFIQRGSIQGLTTAAGIWATSSIGLCYGAGMYLLGAFCGILMLLIEMLFPILFSRMPPRNIMKISVHLQNEASTAEINACLDALQLNHAENHISSDHQGGWYLKTEVVSFRDTDPLKVIEELKKNRNVIDAEVL